MDAADILDQLTHAEGLPKAALQAASAQRAELVPIFLREIDSYLALESANRAKPTPLFFIFHLLGEWREKTAYRPLTRLLRCPTHEVDAILGDGTTTTTHRVMAAVFDDDPEPLDEIILNPRANQFVRSACAKRSPRWCCEGNSIGIWRADFSETRSWSCVRKCDPLSGKGGKAPSRCSG
jgi:hypothetical protein